MRALAARMAPPAMVTPRDTAAASRSASEVAPALTITLSVQAGQPQLPSASKRRVPELTVSVRFLLSLR